MGKLVVVGTGIHIGQLSAEARDWLQCADKVLYCVCDAASERVLLRLNETSESLHTHYADGKDRFDTYAEMTARILACLDLYDTVVVAFYGHPGFFVAPSRQAIRLARERGHEALMLPAVSSFDCLISDLGIDLGSGCQIFEATEAGYGSPDTTSRASTDLHWSQSREPTFIVSPNRASCRRPASSPALIGIAGGWRLACGWRLADPDPQGSRRSVQRSADVAEHDADFCSLRLRDSNEEYGDQRSNQRIFDRRGPGWFVYEFPKDLDHGPCSCSGALDGRVTFGAAISAGESYPPTLSDSLTTF